jgi:hypothetical protein
MLTRWLPHAGISHTYPKQRFVARPQAGSGVGWRYPLGTVRRAPGHGRPYREGVEACQHEVALEVSSDFRAYFRKYPWRP